LITAVDTSILIDVFIGDAKFGPASKAAVDAWALAGRLVACDVVWAEVAGMFPTAEAADAAMRKLGVEFLALTQAESLEAGRAWKAYRARGGKRDRVVADFLVGAQARGSANQLLTRDRGYFKTYFPALALVDPAKP
jgi:predicted nucleic acid-binding protein